MSAATYTAAVTPSPSVTWLSTALHTGIQAAIDELGTDREDVALTATKRAVLRDILLPALQRLVAMLSDTDPTVAPVAESYLPVIDQLSLAAQPATPGAVLAAALRQGAAS